MAKIFVLHENRAWLPPLARALEATGAPWEEWFLTERAIDLSIDFGNRPVGEMRRAVGIGKNAMPAGLEYGLTGIAQRGP